MAELLLLGPTAPCTGIRFAGSKQRFAGRRCPPVHATKMPESGFFAEADPKAEVYAPFLPNEDADITKKGGRYSSEFLWNTNWQAKLAYEESLQKEIEAAKNAEPETPSGFLSFNRVADLNSLDVDLSKQLAPRQKDLASTGRQQQQPPKQVVRSRPGGYPSVSTTKLEQKRWSRGGKFAKKGAVPAPAGEEEVAAAEALRTEERARYDQLALEVQLWTLGTAVLCFAAVNAFYTQEIAVSYGVGAAGGYAYLRMLKRSVDGLGGGGLGAALGQPRLLVPVILVLLFNRWNQIYADDFGLTLQLLPMLAGFFTYKAALVGRHSVALFAELSADPAASVAEAVSMPSLDILCFGVGSAAHSLAQKMYNWSTLNQKVFRRLGFVVAKSECEAVCNCHPGAVERVLKLVRIQLANYAAKQASRSSRSEDDESKCGDETAASEADTTESQPHSPEASAEDPDPAEQQVHAGGRYAQAEPEPAPLVGGVTATVTVQGSQSKSDRAAQQSILHLRETNGILETKVRKLEQLVKLKDIKLQALTAKLQRAGLGDK